MVALAHTRTSEAHACVDQTRPQACGVEELEMKRTKKPANASAMHVRASEEALRQLVVEACETAIENTGHAVDHAVAGAVNRRAPLGQFVSGIVPRGDVPTLKKIEDYTMLELNAAISRGEQQFGKELWWLLVNGVDAFVERRDRQRRGDWSGRR